MRALKVTQVYAADLKKSKPASDKKNDAFWNKMSRAQQEQYLKEHPKSKYAKYPLKKEGSKRDTGKKKITKLTVKKPHAKHEKPKPKVRLSDIVKDWHEEQKDFFREGEHLPDSEERKKVSDIITRKAKGLHKSIKGEVKEWKVATDALRKLKRGEELDHHDKKALKAVALHSGIVIGDLALTGGMASGVAHAIGGLFGGFLSHSLAVNFGKAAVYASPKDVDNETDDELLDELIHYMVRGVRKAPLKPGAWINQFEKVNRHENSKSKK